MEYSTNPPTICSFWPDYTSLLGDREKRWQADGAGIRRVKGQQSRVSLRCSRQSRKWCHFGMMWIRSVGQRRLGASHHQCPWFLLASFIFPIAASLLALLLRPPPSLSIICLSDLIFGNWKYRPRLLSNSDFPKSKVQICLPSRRQSKSQCWFEGSRRKTGRPDETSHTFLPL